MSDSALTHTCRFDSRDTCKRSWTFVLRSEGGNLVIQDLTITDDRREDGNIQGCQGHPKTIVALVKGRTVDSIDLAALAAAGCPRNKACGQVLAECLRSVGTGRASS